MFLCSCLYSHIIDVNYALGMEITAFIVGRYQHQQCVIIIIRNASWRDWEVEIMLLVSFHVDLIRSQKYTDENWMKFWRTLDGARGTLRSYIEKLAIDSKEFIEMYLKTEFSCRFYSRTKKRKKKRKNQYFRGFIQRKQTNHCLQFRC